MSSLDISIVVCTFNRARYLEDTLRTLGDQRGVDGRYEVVLVDNNSTDDTADVVRAFAAAHPDVPLRYVVETKQGLSRARNRGIAEARAPLVAFVDDDIFADDTLAESFVRGLAEHPEAMAAGGQIAVHFDDDVPEWISPHLMPLLGHHNLGDRARPYPKGRYPFGGNMCFRRQAFDAVGVFDPALGRSANAMLGSEEKDLFRRLERAGGTVLYVPGARLRHRVGAIRLADDFVRRQAIGIGRGERLRVTNAGPAAVLGKVASEIVKTAGTIAIAGRFALAGAPEKARMLLRFRGWVWTGLLQR